jgi:hypothetical protein
MCGAHMTQGPNGVPGTIVQHHGLRIELGT